MNIRNVENIPLIDRTPLTVDTGRGDSESGAEKSGTNTHLSEKLGNLFVPKVCDD